MNSNTAELWAKHNRHDGDRWRLFRAVADAVPARSVFYPGSYIDIAPSFVFDAVTYLDTDKRAPKFFGDHAGIQDIVTKHHGPHDVDVTFIHADYTAKLDLPLSHFDLLVSLYAGFISEHCTQHLRVGGTLLVNPSHGDAAMASIDPRYDLSGVLNSVDGNYTVSTSDLDSYLIPKKPHPITIDALHETGRGISYTTSPFAYLFTRVK